MTLRDRIREIPAGTELLREIRYYTDDQLADLTEGELDNVTRWLRAASYSALEGARRLERHRNDRTPTCSPSTPSTTEAPPPSPSTLTSPTQAET